MNSRTRSLRATATLALGTPAAMHEREVGPLEIGIHARGMRGGLPEGEAEQRAALLGDMAEVIFIGGGIEGRGQADVADHVLAVVEAGHGAQDDDGGQRRQGPDAGMGDEARATVVMASSSARIWAVSPASSSRL